TRPPLLETSWDVYDRSVFTPNDQFFVRWHWAVIPERVDVTAFKLTVRGHVNQTLSLSLADLLAMPRVELAAVCQCSGNSRGLFQPRVAARSGGSPRAERAGATDGEEGSEPGGAEDGGSRRSRGRTQRVARCHRGRRRWWLVHCAGAHEPRRDDGFR